jgi:IclR family transcriptional regulator, acetate operon repressor
MLILLAEEVDPPTVSEVAARMGLSMSTASRIALALLRHRLLARDGRGRLHAGSALVHLAGRGGFNSWLVSAADQSLDLIAQHTGETVTLAVPEAGRVQHLAQRQSSYAIGATDWVGRTVPPHCSSTGKVFIAFSVLPFPRLLDRLTDHTITDRARLERELDVVRKDGFAMTRDELEVGLVAIAAPVMDPGGRTVAALSVSGPSTRLTRQRSREIADLVRTEGNRLSQRLRGDAADPVSDLRQASGGTRR